ncbi:heterokaryon incompatibility protein-domain-containing protein [Hypoxylon argillaceum]|nr:heterokaryon incompatibility protein-domain-containing protein [Hypoxylon argillaceum]
MGSNCQGCEALWRLRIGYVEHRFSDGVCLNHIPLARQFWDRDGEHHYSKNKFHYNGQTTTTRGAIKLVDSSIRRWELMLVNEVSAPINNLGKGRILDPDWVDIDLLQWKDRCLKTHRERCDNPMKIWSTRPAWLIDVKQKCLVPGAKTDGRRYVALSYQYGTGSWLRITEAATLSSLEILGSLDKAEVLPAISPMIRHAMYLTTVLGERFLWADALCIPHYDAATTTEQLNLMGAIYANATVTITAADTHSGQGIPGLRGVSKPREIEQRVIQFGTKQIVAQPAEYGHHPFRLPLPYNRRGWTYQECMMSSRKVIFARGELIWECPCSYRKEGLAPSVNAHPRFSPSHRMSPILAGFPDTESLHEILAEFQRRELTYDSDALASITGLLSVFSRTFSGGFLYGLPEKFFDSALGWRASFHRRRHNVSPGSSRLGPSGLPSWSWIGWENRERGPFSTNHCDNALVYAGIRTSTRETFPITKWFTAKSPTVTAAERRPIFSTWPTDRETYKDPSNALPTGWTRHEAPKHIGGMPVAYPDGCGSSIFIHEDMKDERDADPGEERTNWWYYPVPVADISASTLPFTPEQTEYLFCRTHKACLWAAGRGTLKPNTQVNLWNAEKTKVGFLQPTGMIEQDMFPADVSSRVEGSRERGGEELIGTGVDLVAISRVREYKSSGRLGTVSTTEHMVVLWVEWADGVAYRQGYGEVYKEAWDKLPLESIELVLG